MRDELLDSEILDSVKEPQVLIEFDERNTITSDRTATWLAGYLLQPPSCLTLPIFSSDSNINSGIIVRGRSGHIIDVADIHGMQLGKDIL